MRFVFLAKKNPTILLQPQTAEYKFLITRLVQQMEIYGKYDTPSVEIKVLKNFYVIIDP